MDFLIGYSIVFVVVAWALNRRYRRWQAGRRTSAQPAHSSSSPINLAELCTFVQELEDTTDLVARMRAESQR